MVCIYYVVILWVDSSIYKFDVYSLLWNRSCLYYIYLYILVVMLYVYYSYNEE